MYDAIFAELTTRSPELYRIFHIGRKLNADDDPLVPELDALLQPETRQRDTEKTATKSIETDLEWHVDVMQKYTDVYKSLKKQFLYPDAIFDQKLIGRELLVRQPDVAEETISWQQHLDESNSDNAIKRKRRQSTYLLIDTSGTTAAHHRLLLEKAIALNFIQNNGRENGKVWLRFFNHDVSRLFTSEELATSKMLWEKLFYPLAPFGATNINNALQTALTDIRNEALTDRVELLVLTDGLALLDNAQLDIPPSLKIHFVVIGNDRPKLTDAEHDDYIESKLKRWQKQWQPKLSQGEYAAHYEKMQRDLAAKGDNLLEEYYDEMRLSLRALATQTGGQFIEVDDISDDFFCTDELFKDLADEMDAAMMAYKAEAPFTEKETLLEKIISLQNYINKLQRDRKSLKRAQKNHLKQFSTQVRQLLENDDEMMEILRNGRISVQLTGNGSPRQMSLLDIFKLLFLKARTYFFRTSH
jgi:hypothetical protein